MNRQLAPAIAAYALMGLWLVLVMAVPARAQDALTPSRIADHVEEIRVAVIAQGAQADAEISLAAPNAEIRIAEGGTIVIETVSFNRASGRFLIRARGAPGEPLIAISGAAAVSVTLPVPARAIPRGGIITEEDIDFIEIIDGAAPHYLDDAGLIIGKEARRPLAQGFPLRANDLKSQIVIKRGAAVTVILEGPGLRLTQAASALENGAEGDFISFRNLTSGAEIKAAVISASVARAPIGAVRARHAAYSPE